MYGQYGIYGGMYQNPYSGNVYQTQQQTAQQIIKVNGENGARAYQMPANSSALLLDESAPIVWLKQTDGAGYPTLTPYRIEPYAPEPEPDYRSLLSRIEKLEGLINGKSNFTDVEQKTTEQPGKYHTAGKREPTGNV